MAYPITEINRFRRFRLFPVTEIIPSPYRGEDIFGGYLWDAFMKASLSIPMARGP